VVKNGSLKPITSKERGFSLNYFIQNHLGKTHRTRSRPNKRSILFQVPLNKIVIPLKST